MKVSNYDFSDLSDDLEEWRDGVATILNYGKYQIPTVTTAPTWTGNKGETAFVMPSSGGTTLYVMRNTAWVALLSVAV